MDHNGLIFRYLSIASSNLLKRDMQCPFEASTNPLNYEILSNLFLLASLGKGLNCTHFFIAI
jgi:hypothetical protein